MSLPDTVFIFVLALIIFGPKKLPEIGRQLGKLVGEFRRASNEFKFQIEEELRQAELADRNTIAPAKKELETATSAESSTDIAESPTPEPLYPEETLPVGQYPNIDTVNPQDLSSAESTRAEDAAHAPAGAENSAEEPVIKAAVGIEPRTMLPYSAAPTPEPPSPAIHESEAASATSLHNHEPADPYAAPTVADVTHG
jgi:sec-independent protein translocase protein TatB